MGANLIATFIGVVTGTAGYWFTTFWMKPILQYRQPKSSVLIDLVFCAQVVNADGMNERLQELYKERMESNRRRSAEIEACLLELPRWYSVWLRLRGCSPKRAATDLLGLSNTSDYHAAAVRVERIKAAVGIKTDVV